MSHLKAGSTTTRQKVDLIISNREKYSISAMCKLLKVSRSLVYYHINKEISTNSSEELIITNHIKSIFKRSRNNYGTRKIKKELGKLNYQVSRRRISRIMKENGLVSNYTVAQFKVHPAACNQSSTPNIVDRDFNDREKLEVAVSDLTYVRVGNKWNYICTLIDLFNREIIGYSAGANKNAELVETALLRCNYSLQDIRVFHSDRGNEYDNILIDDILTIFKIDRSLEQLQLQLAEHIYWYNNIRIHESLGYMTPVEYRELNTKKLGKAS